MKENIRRVFLKPYFIFAFISLALVAILFRGGNALGGGEVGTPFYNLNRMFEMSAMSWSDRALGADYGFSVGGAPYYKTFSILQDLGVPGFLLQASFFFLCIYLTLFFSYRLMGEVFPNVSTAGRFASALFYLVNPYALVNVWNRFLPNTIQFYSFLPLSFWLFIRGLKAEKYYYAVLNMLLTAIFSVGFIGPSQMVIYWSLLFLLFVYYFVFIKRSRFVVLYFIANAGLWFIFNFSWISHELYFRFSSSFQAVSTFFFTGKGNLETFNVLSRVLGKISNVLLLQHASFFNESIDFPFNWPLFYRYPLALVLQWFFVILTLVIAFIRRKNVWVCFFLTIFFIGIFATKGNSQPLGGLMGFLFNKVSFLEFFRNPFEKAGLLLPLGFSPLFGLAIFELSNWAKKLNKPLNMAIRFLPWFYLIIFLGFPFWTSLVFTSGYPPANNIKIGYQVSPPEYYSKADKYLSSQPGIFRFITFPLGGEGIFNTWPKGYTGVEQSGVLFSVPGISYGTTIPYYDSFIRKIEELFVKNEDFYKVARLFNAQYLLYRPDFDFKLSYMRDPKMIDNIFASRVNDPNSKLTFVSSFGPLKLYKYFDEMFLPKVYATGGLIINNLPGKIGDIFFGKDNKNYTIFTTEDSKDRPSFLEQDYANVAHNYEFFEIDSPFPMYSDDPWIFPYVNNLPSSKIYPLILLKEKLQGLEKISLEDKTNWELSLLGKRISEARKAVNQGDFVAARRALQEYTRILPSFISKLDILNSTTRQSGENVWHEHDLFKAFSAHFYVLNELEKTSLNESDFITTLTGNLKAALSKKNITPVHDVISTQTFPIQHRIVYQINVTEDGDYEILIPKTKTFPDSFDFQKYISIQVDDAVVSEQVILKDQYISLGKVHFSSGMHNLGINQMPGQNLVSRTSFDVEAKDSDVNITIPIENFDSYEHFRISFDFRVEYGAPLNYSIVQNTDQLPTKTKPQLGKNLAPDNYMYGYRTFNDSFQPNPSADSAALSFSIIPWNNCLLVNKSNPRKCNDENIKVIYRKPTRITVENIKVLPDMPRDIVLLKQDEGEMAVPSSISFDRINSTKYIAHIQEAKEPFLLVFSELYDSGWRAYLADAGIKANEIPLNQEWRKNMVSKEDHILVNGYANAWWIDRTGDFEVVLEYGPQRLLYVGYAISAISALAAVGYLLSRMVSKKLDYVK